MNDRYKTYNPAHTAADGSTPNRAGIPDNATSDSPIPIHAHARNAPSDAVQWKMLGVNRNGTSLRYGPAGRRPRSPASGRNWFSVTTNATRYMMARPRSKSQREYQ